MKRFLLSFVAVVGLLATSCVQDATSDMELNKQGVVTFAVDAQHTSRAYGVAAEAKDLYYAVYQNGDLLEAISVLPVLPGEVPVTEPVTLVNGAANVSIPLATGLEYEFIFWAASPYAIDEDLYSFDWTNKTMTLNANALVASDESLDAFYKYDKFTVSGNETHPETLKRPFAQINVATGDTVKAANAGLTVAETWFEVSGAYNTLNLATGIAEGAETLNYTIAAKPATTEKITANSKDYDLLGVIYVLANEGESSLNNVKFSYNRNAGETTAVKTVEVPSAPIKRNARTNLVGNILTSNNGFDVDIDEGFEEPGTNIEVWDGSTVKEPAYDEATKTYSISCAAELAYIAQLVNGTLDTDNVSRAAVAANSLAGCTVKLVNDIALNDMEWTPIGNGKHFMGTFDGNHKTISGLKVTKRGDCRAALFGTVSGTVVFRNLTISGAEVRCPDFEGDFYGSALIGTAYGVVTIENVDVVDSYISGNNKVGALIAHDGVMNTLTVSGCDVSGTTFETLNAADGGSVGGLLGYFQTGGEHHITNCSVKGCTFNVVNSTNTGKRANGLLFGGIDSKAGQKLYINGAVIENNTWSEKFYVDGVEVTEGKFVSPYGGLIGGERDDKAEGELYINDELFVLPVATAEDLKKAIANKVSTIKVIGEIDLADVVLSGYNGTIVGVDDSACLNTRNFVPGPNEAYSLRCTNIAFQNIDFKLPTHSNYYTTGFVGTGDISFENCDFEGSTVLNSANAAATNWTFTECNFVSVESGAYASWVYAGTKATFNECTFAGVDRAAKIYGDGGEVEVEYNDCTFTSSTLNKSGVEIDSSHTTITAAFNNCSQTGTPGLYAVTGTKATVYVDGEAVIVAGLTTVDGYSKLFVNADKSEYTVYSAEGLIQLHDYWAANVYSNHMWGKTYSIGADIDATGHPWNSVYVVVGNNANNGFVIDGKGHTISNLAINGSLFTGTPNGGNADTTPGVVRNLTFDNATVANAAVGYGTAVIWGNTYGEVTFEDVHIVNSSVTGVCDVAAFVGATSIDSGTINPIKFINCSVENCTITAIGGDGCDPTGASGYVGRAFADTYLVFEGANSVDEATVLNNNNGLVGGRVYGYTAWVGNGFAGTGASDEFVNLNGVTVE